LGSDFRPTDGWVINLFYSSSHLISVLTLCYHSSSSPPFGNKYVLIVYICGEYVDE
jgi:hypothetical protein